MMIQVWQRVRSVLGRGAPGSQHSRADRGRAYTRLLLSHLLVSPTATGQPPTRLHLQALYQVSVMLLILFAGPVLIDKYRIRGECEAFRDAAESEPLGPDYFCLTDDVLAIRGGPAMCERMYASDSVCPASFSEPEQAAFCGGEATDCADFKLAHKVGDY